MEINTLVQLDNSKMTDADMMKYPSFWHDGTELCFIGEIPNKPGFCILVATGHTYVGVPMSLFREVPMRDTLGIRIVETKKEA